MRTTVNGKVILAPSARLRLAEAEAAGVSLTIEELTSSFAAGELAQWDGSQFVGRRAAIPAAIAMRTPFQDVSVTLGNLGAGTVSLASLVPPAGYRTAFHLFCINNTASQIIALLQVTRGGNTYRMSQVTVAANGGVGIIYYIPLAFEAGDIAEMVTDNPNLFVSARAWRVRLTHPWKPLCVPFANGETTLYTCPAGKVARPTQAMTLFGNPTLGYTATGGQLDTVDIFYVPNGETVLTGYRVIPTRTVTLANNLAWLQMMSLELAAGDKLVVVASTAFLGLATLCLWERDA